MFNKMPRDGQNKNVMQQASQSFRLHKIKVGEEAFSPLMIAQKGRKARRKANPPVKQENLGGSSSKSVEAKNTNKVNQKIGQGSRFESLMDWEIMEENLNEDTENVSGNTELMIVHENPLS